MTERNKISMENAKKKVLRFIDLKLEPKNNITKLFDMYGIDMEYVKLCINQCYDEDAIIDLYVLSKIDLSSSKKFFISYCMKLCRYIMSIKDYGYYNKNITFQEFNIYKKYYVRIFELLYNSRSTYLFGRICGTDPRSITIREETRIFDDVIKELNNIYICELPEDLQDYYYFILNNDPYGMAKYIEEKFGDPRKNNYNNIIENIEKSLSMFNIIDFLRDSPISVSRTLFEFSKIYFRYLKDSGLEDYYDEAYNPEKEDAKNAKIVLEEFLHSKFAAIEDFYYSNYPDRDYGKDKFLVEHFYPELFLKVSEIIDSQSKHRYAIICDTARQLKDAIIRSRYKLSILDFLKIYNPGSLEGLIYYRSKIIPTLPTDSNKVLYSYLRRLNYLKINDRDVMNSIVICNGITLVDEDKIKILNYIKNNKLPYMQSVYMAIYREYLKGDLDLDKPFK